MTTEREEFENKIWRIIDVPSRDETDVLIDKLWSWHQQSVEKAVEKERERIKSEVEYWSERNSWTADEDNHVDPVKEVFVVAIEDLKEKLDSSWEERLELTLDTYKSLIDSDQEEYKMARKYLKDFIRHEKQLSYQEGVEKVEKMLIADFPLGWKIIRQTRGRQHHKDCSYVQSHKGLLCDCVGIDVVTLLVKHFRHQLSILRGEK